MRPINIYELTRITSTLQLQKAERQSSKRNRPMNIKPWEVSSLFALANHLFLKLQSIEKLDFYYSFQIPKLGKEFDLLRINDDTVINIELKSRQVSDEKIKNQLKLNRYYLSTLGKNMRTYTYISSEDRLVRLTNGGHLMESNWDELCEDLRLQDHCYEDHIEKLFEEEQFIISPLTDPERFLRREYFLTSQQKDIRNRILKNIENGLLFQGFTGLPGTGKTLLLYDIAMELSEKQRVCVLHFGSFPEELSHLNERLKRIDFYPCTRDEELFNLSGYDFILVDEGHRMGEENLKELKTYVLEHKIPCIFSYDKEDAISMEERPCDISEKIDALPDFGKFCLTNRIRMNGELSSFIYFVMQVSRAHNHREYPSVSLLYANDKEEAKVLIGHYKEKGYIYIRDQKEDADPTDSFHEIDASLATCREFDQVLMVMDERFYYDKEGFLRSLASSAQFQNDGIHHKDVSVKESPVRRLFHGLHRAKEKLAILVVGNEAVFEQLLFVIQN